MHSVEIRREIVERVLARRGQLHLFESLDAKRSALLVIDLQNARLIQTVIGVYEILNV